MKKYLIDFETKSDLNLKTSGMMKYFHTPNSAIVCIGWTELTSLGPGPAQLWLPPGQPPFNLDPDCVIYAHNVEFDRCAWNFLGKRYGWPELLPEQCIDIMAICGRYTYPQGLDFVANVLNLKHKKNPRGKYLIKKITQPPFKYTDQELREFYNYCLDDVEAEAELLSQLPMDRLDRREQQIWLSTVKINRLGVPIDTEMAARVYATIDFYRKKKMKMVPIITDGRVQTINQVGKIVEWLQEQGVNIDNLRADTVTEFLDRDIPEDCRDILLLRQELGSSSVAKYKKLLAQTHEGRIYDNLRYYTASTGRWGGLGFQLHNLPRAKVEDIESTIDKFFDTRILNENPVYAGKALIRSTITAGRGKELGVADYSGIENRIIAWVAGETRITELHRQGLDEYIDFASDLYGVKYEDIDSDQRFFGKTVVLGAGYNLGAPGLLGYAEGYGLHIDLDQAKIAINKYRETHPNIKNFWYAVRDAALRAIENPGVEFCVRLCAFKCVMDRNGRFWLKLTLPSGRSLYYSDPKIKQDSFGPVPTHMGVNSYNKKWQRLKLIPGRITENIVQALARDVLAHGVLNLQNVDYDVIAHIHDEIVCEWDKGGEQHLEDMVAIMCINPSWCPDLPLAAEGVTLHRYKKI